MDAAGQAGLWTISADRSGIQPVGVTDGRVDPVARRTVLGGRPGRFDAAGRTHRRSGSRLELLETGLGTIARGAGFVRDGLARATGFPLKMRERAREPWLVNLR